MENTLIQLKSLGILPVVAIDNATNAEKLSQSLLDCGFPCARITFRTQAASEAMCRLITLRAICRPYPQGPFIPTGGINHSNLGTYLALSQVVACGGSWLVKKQLIADGKFKQITLFSRKAVDVVQQARSEKR